MMLLNVTWSRMAVCCVVMLYVKQNSKFYIFFAKPCMVCIIGMPVTKHTSVYTARVCLCNVVVVINIVAVS